MGKILQKIQKAMGKRSFVTRFVLNMLCATTTGWNTYNFFLCAVATDNSLFYFLGVRANSVVLIFEQWALYANIVPVTLFS